MFINALQSCGRFTVSERRVPRFKIMKTFPLPSACALAFAMICAPVHAADPQPAAASAEMQALVAQLLQALAAAQAEPAPDSSPAPLPAASAPAPRASPRATSSLQTGHLSTTSLAPSASLGGRGTSGGIPRLNDDDWRLLFPIRQARP